MICTELEMYDEDLVPCCTLYFSHTLASKRADIARDRYP